MRIGIVNDHAPVLETLRGVIVSGGHLLAWMAYDGEQAVEMCCGDVPDLVLMDLNMPGMDGVEATRMIMTRCPCPILVVTSDIRRNSSRVFEAMGAGALDAVPAPGCRDCGGTDNGKGLMDKIAMIESLRKSHESRVPAAGSPVRIKARPPILAVGCSTGGPTALARMLGALRGDFPAAVIVVQHVDGCFSESLARWLDSQCRVKVRLARAGDIPVAGEVLIAPGDTHLTIEKGMMVGLKSGNGESPYIPSVDVFFRSLCRQPLIPGSVALLLTGMGADGAEGMLELRSLGWTTMAQDEETSVVWGMPGIAVKKGAVSHILPLEAMAPTLERHFNKYRKMEKRA